MANEFIIKNGFHSKGDSEITGSLEVSGSNTNFILNSTDSKFTDSRATTKGIEYNADYSSNFTSRSLVDRDYVDNNITNNITASAGSGLTYNTSSGRIDLGGEVNGFPDDPSNTDNRIFFTPTFGTNIWYYGLENRPGSGSFIPTSSFGTSIYIDQTFNYSYNGYKNVIGLYGSMIDNGTPQIGVWESQGPMIYLKQYKDITSLFDSNGRAIGFPGPSSNILHTVSETPSICRRSMWATGSNANNTISGSNIWQDPTRFFAQITGSSLNEHSNFYLDKNGFSAGNTTNVGSFPGTSLLLVRTSGVNLYDASYCGIASFPDKSTRVGSIFGGHLQIQSSGSFDSTFTDSTDNKRGIKYIGFGETNTETGAGANYNTLVGTSLVPKKYLEDYVAASASADTIYTADGVLTGDRVVDLDGNSFEFTSSAAYNATPINFEFGGAFPGYTRWDGTGAIQIKANGNTDPLKVYKKVDASNPNFVSKYGGGGHLGSDGGIWTVSQTYGGTSTRIELSQAASKHYHGSSEHHRIQLGGGAASGVYFWRNGYSSLGGFIVGGTAVVGTENISLQGETLISKKLELSTTADGFLMPRLTTAQMNAILTPDTHLLIFNTTLNALYRYNGSAWVAMSAGYGIIEVKDSSGNPTFYADLQSALETCKTAGSSNTINIYSNITITSSININRGGSGVGNGYQYKNLTIDFNGFTLTNNETDSSYCFDISFGNIASENRQITFKNGIVNRTSGTGTHYALHCDETENDGDLIMSNMKWYCENSNTARLEIDELDSSYKDFGGSVFESDGGTPLRLQHYSCKNFTTISNSSSGSVVLVSGAKATNFEVINTSTGDGIDIGGDSDVSFFKVKTTSGIGIDCSDDCQGVFTNFYIETTTGDGIDTLGTNAAYKLRFSNFEIRCDNGICIDSNHTNTFFSNFTLSNNGSTYTISTANNSQSTFSNGTAINYGSGQVVYVGNTTNLNFKHIDFISKGGSIGTISVDNSNYNVYFENCTFHTEFDDAAGVNLTISNSTGTIVLTTCSFRVTNSSANCIYATSSKTVSVGNSNFKGATTPINSNVTLSNTNTMDDFGNILIG